MANEESGATSSDDIFSVGYEKAIDLMEACSTQHGFLASPTERANYRRIWGRDGCILGLAALLSGKPDLIETCRRTLDTLARNQGAHGEIPSNVDPRTRRVSYGGTAGRVDANLWFIICCAEYFRVTGDMDFFNAMVEHIEKVRFLLGAWEYNTRGLLYVPLTGDWSDEYIQTGYVLYDQLLYLQVQRELCAMHRGLHSTSDHHLRQKLSNLRHLIRANYWFRGDDETPDDVYHEVLYKKGLGAHCRCADRYWLAFFSPAGYGYRFDALANTLASLVGVADHHQRERVDEYVAAEVADRKVMLLPAFHPVITPMDEDWEDLQMTFQYAFKNKPYEYHNGGLWPFVTGFYVADLARRGKTDLARRYLEGIHRANATASGGEEWSFPEFLHGQEHTPGGTRHQGWSAAAVVIAQEVLNGKGFLPVNVG